MMKLALLFFVFLQGVLSAMTKEEILKLNKEKHDTTNLVEELKVFPLGREFIFDLEFVMPQPHAMKKLPAVSKIVQGKYIVYSYDLPLVDGGADDVDPGSIKVVSVVAYDAENQCYKEWSLFGDTDEVAEYTGITVKGSNSFAWVRVDKHQDEGSMLLRHETINGDKIEWTESLYAKGKLVFILKGTVKKVK